MVLVLPRSIFQTILKCCGQGEGRSSCSSYVALAWAHAVLQAIYLMSDLHSGPYVDSSCRGMILLYRYSNSIKYTRRFDLVGWEGQKAESSEQRCQCHLFHFSHSKAWRACGLFGETPGKKRGEAHTGSYVLMIYVTTFAEDEAENACEGSGTKGSIVFARKKWEIDMQIGKWHATSMCLKCLLAGYLLLSACSARFATGNWEIQGTGRVVWVWLCFFLELLGVT